MRVGIDATPLTVPAGGIARYTSELARALAAEFPEDEYWLLSDQSWKDGPNAANLRRGRAPSSWLTRRWWLAGLPLELRRLGIEVFHGTDFGALYVPVAPSVMTLHDLSPWKTGELRAEGAERIRRRTPYLVRAATMILTDSESVRREVIEHFNVSPSRVVAVALAAGPQFYPRAADEVEAILARFGISHPYLLFVGSDDPRKNAGRLIAAWREARRHVTGLNLVLAGRIGDDFLHKEVLNSTEAPGLVFVGQPADPEIAALMTGAAVFVYPSLYEGFGLPVLEAMQAGAPVLVSREASLIEMSADAAVVAGAESVSELARAIVELMADPKWRLELRERGIRRAAQFSWRQTAIRTREVYVEALRRF